MEIERHRAPIRIALIYLTVTIGFLAIWILVAPRGFYDNFPGGSVLTGYPRCRPTTSTWSVTSGPPRSVSPCWQGWPRTGWIAA